MYTLLTKEKALLNKFESEMTKLKHQTGTSEQKQQLYTALNDKREQFLYRKFSNYNDQVSRFIQYCATFDILVSLASVGLSFLNTVPSTNPVLHQARLSILSLLLRPGYPDGRLRETGLLPDQVVPSDPASTAPTTLSAR